MNKLKPILLGLTVAALASSPVQAALTQVNGIWGTEPDGDNSGEWNLYDSGFGSSQGTGIMEYLYGAGNFVRVDDAMDISWVGTPGAFVFDALYAGASQALHTSGVSGSPESTALLTLAGSTANTPPARSGSSTAINPISQPFLFLDRANGNVAYSDPALSSGLQDRMVTFAVNGYLTTAGDGSTYTAFSDAPRFVIAFEDGTDMDYNDLVVEVSGVAPVPEASTVIAAVLLLLPLGMSTARIIRKHRATGLS